MPQTSDRRSHFEEDFPVDCWGFDNSRINEITSINIRSYVLTVLTKSEGQDAQHFWRLELKAQLAVTIRYISHKLNYRSSHCHSRPPACHDTCCGFPRYRCMYEREDVRKPPPSARFDNARGSMFNIPPSFYALAMAGSCLHSAGRKTKLGG